MLVRTDIPLAQQIVQVGHACLEAGKHFDWPVEPCNLVVLGVASQHDLQVTTECVQLAGIRLTVFYEPDFDLGASAACTEPLNGPIRRVFRHLPLWDETISSAPARGPPVVGFTITPLMQQDIIINRIG